MRGGTTSAQGGKTLVDVATLKKALMMRDEQGRAVADVEKVLGLKGGVVSGLGRVGVLEVA